jgi:predicted HAD superfamily Cof-like phosphohydrolase
MTEDVLEQTALWFEKAVPYPTTKNLHTQVGCHFEEVVEMIQSIHSEDTNTTYLLVAAETALKELADHLKASDKKISVPARLQKDLLDALCDQIVTAVGTAHMLHFDIHGALQIVNGSNWSKFVDGKPVFDANQKIQKGPNYFKADLSRFVPPAIN